MAYIKLKSGREIRGWRAALIAFPFVVLLSPFLLLYGLMAMGVWFAVAVPVLIMSRVRRG